MENFTFCAVQVSHCVANELNNADEYGGFWERFIVPQNLLTLLGQFRGLCTGFNIEVLKVGKKIVKQHILLYKSFD